MAKSSHVNAENEVNISLLIGQWHFAPWHCVFGKHFEQDTHRIFFLRRIACSSLFNVVAKTCVLNANRETF